LTNILKRDKKIVLFCHLILPLNKMAKVSKAKPITEEPKGTYWQKLEGEVQNNQSKVSMILGALIIIVTGFLIFNFFNKDKAPDLGPAQNTQDQDGNKDVSTESLPGTYTVKEGDTLFLIAKKYYGDGYKFNLISKANNLNNPNLIEKGQTLMIPEASNTDTTTMEKTQNEEPLPGSKGSMDSKLDQTIWGEKIEGETYIVQKGDWLSTIAGRAYGDIFSYKKIAEANNIINPNLIEPGVILKIPR
jgi:nucleoid-associated protein YgaU